jgi:hypothetical protein
VCTDIGFTPYRHFNVRKSETSDLRGFPKRSCSIKDLSAMTSDVIALWASVGF